MKIVRLIKKRFQIVIIVLFLLIGLGTFGFTMLKETITKAEIIREELRVTTDFEDMGVNPSKIYMLKNRLSLPCIQGCLIKPKKVIHLTSLMK